MCPAMTMLRAVSCKHSYMFTCTDRSEQVSYSLSESIIMEARTVARYYPATDLYGLILPYYGRGLISASFMAFSLPSTVTRLAQMMTQLSSEHDRRDTTGLATNLSASGPEDRCDEDNEEVDMQGLITGTNGRVNHLRADNRTTRQRLSTNSPSIRSSHIVRCQSFDPM